MPVPTTSLDVRRDARKYDRLINALGSATFAIRQLEEDGVTDIDQILVHLLPDVAHALNAEHAFVALLQGQKSGEPYFELSVVHPKESLCGKQLPYVNVQKQVAEEEYPIVYDPLGDEDAPVIDGLELFEANAVVMVRMGIGKQVRIVGVCNKTAAAGDEMFLAADGKMLNSIVELIAMGARIGARRQQELQTIQATSAAISGELEQRELLPLITKGAREIFDASAVGLMLLDDNDQVYLFQAHDGLSEEYINNQSISKEQVDDILDGLGEPKPYLVADLRQESYGSETLIVREDVRTVLSAPLMLKSKIIGLLNIYSKTQTRTFSSFELELAQIFANHAANAITNAQLYEASVRWADHLAALYEASKAISSGYVENQAQMLDLIIEQAVERISRVDGPRANWGLIVLYRENENLLDFAAVYAPGYPELERIVGEQRPLDSEKIPDGRIGIAGRTAVQQRTQLVDDVRIDPDYVPLLDSTLSELTVPLLDGNQLIGVLGIESDEIAAFDNNDKIILQALADLAVLAIKNTRQTGQLRRANTVAVMGAWGADIAHDLKREVGNIRRAVYIASRSDDLSTGVQNTLTQIDGYAANLALPQLPESPPDLGSAAKVREKSRWDEEVRDSLARVRARASDKSIEWREEYNCPGAEAAIHPQWLNRLVRHLVRNAINALQPDKPRCITVRTMSRGVFSVVEVQDTGKGVRPEIRDDLFRRPIEHAQGRQGQGLILVRFLTEQHGGYADIVWSEVGEGSTFVFAIPHADNSDNGSEAE